MKFQFIEKYRSIFRIKKMCQTLKISRSGYYKWRNRISNTRHKENEVLRIKIREIFEINNKLYGSPRITKELQSKGIKCSKNRVSRIMNQEGLIAKTKKKFKRTTDSTHTHLISPNKLKALAPITQPNQIWVSDITYIWTKEGWLYLAIILDLYSRKIVGWSMSNRLKKALVTNALMMAIFRRNPHSGIIFHSDRGSQYASKEVRNILKYHGFIQSMSSKGNCYDNAYAESFFHTLKTEEVYWNYYLSRKEAQNCIYKYIELYYNTKRRHSGISYLSPNEFENKILVNNCA